MNTIAEIDFLTLTFIPCQGSKIWLTQIQKKKVVLITMKGGGSSKQRAQDILTLKKMVEEGKMKPLIDRTYSMGQIAEAHKYVEKGHKVGNVVTKILEE